MFAYRCEHNIRLGQEPRNVTAGSHCQRMTQVFRNPETVLLSSCAVSRSHQPRSMCAADDALHSRQHLALSLCFASGVQRQLAVVSTCMVNS